MELCGYAVNEGFDDVECCRGLKSISPEGCANCATKFQFNPDEAYEYWLETRYTGLCD